MDSNLCRVRDAYNIIADKYESALSDYEIYNYSCFFQSFDGKYALDLGCGQGRIAEYCFEMKSLNVLGCDISKKMLGIAKKRNSHPKEVAFILSDMQEVSSTIVFDAAIASFSLIHLTYSQAANTLLNLRKLLKDGGSLFISLLSGEFSGYVTDPLNVSVKIFVKQYTIDEITSLLISCGYSVTTINFGEDNDVAALSKDAMFVFARKEQKL